MRIENLECASPGSKVRAGKSDSGVDASIQNLSLHSEQKLEGRELLLKYPCP